MAHYYIRDDGGSNVGTATGDGGRYTSQKTGTWAAAFSATSEYYSNLNGPLEATTPVAVGDVIYFGDDSDCESPNDNTFNIGSIGDAGILVVSVDVNDIEAYKPGAVNLNAGVSDLNFYNVVFIAGVSINTGDNGLLRDGATVRIIDAESSHSDIPVGCSGSNTQLELVNVNIGHHVLNGQGIRIYGGMVFNWRGGSWVSETPVSLFDPVNLAVGGGGKVEIVGVDLSIVTTKVINSVLSKSVNDGFLFRLSHCKISASMILPYTEFTRAFHRFEMYNCDEGTDDDYHRFYIADGAGRVTNNDSTYVTDTQVWYEGSDKSSMEVETQALCSHVSPFIFELPAQYVDLSDATTDTIYIDILVDSDTLTLTDTDIAFFLCYPDGTTAVQPNWITTGKTVGTGNYGIDPLAAGTTLTNTDGLAPSAWTKSGFTTPATYRVKLDTSVDVGQATAVSIRCEVYKASILAGDLFIHPLITVSGS